MNRAVCIIGFLLIGSLTGTCFADDNSGYVVYLQGGAGTLLKGANGTMDLTIHTMIPYYFIAIMNRNILMPLSHESVFEIPLNAAFVSNGEEGEEVYLIKINSWNYDPETNELNLGITPLEFYEGDLLKRFADLKNELSAYKEGEAIRSGLYLEIIRDIPENSGDEISLPCQVCGKEFVMSKRACQYLKADVRMAGCSIV